MTPVRTRRSTLPWFVSLIVLAACGGSHSPASTTGLSTARVDTPRAASRVANIPAVREDGRLPSGVAPVAYGWDVVVDPTRPRFSAKVRIGVQVSAPTRAIVLHGRGLEIRSAVILGSFGSLTATASSRQAAHAKSEADELVLSTASDVPPGTATIELAYDAPFASGLHGLYRVDEAGKSYAFTQFEPIGARMALPCFDEPGFKVPFDVTVNVPKDFVALSNMPEAKRTLSEDGATVNIAFERTPPLPTYLVALAVGPIELRDGAPAGPVPIRLGAVPGRTALGNFGLEAARDHLGVLEKYFGTPYPYPKLDLLAVPNFAAGAMENAGLVTFREERLLLDPATASTAMRRAVSGVMAHELAHMWFGDLVTLAWWNDIWLNEGFATWMATRVLDTWRPEMGAGVDELGAIAHVLDVDTLSSARKVRQPVRSTTEALEAFDGITYEKGAALLGMVESWISPELFQKGVRAYLGEHRMGNASASDLFGALGRASGQDVAGVLGSFTEQTGVPSVELSSCRLERGSPVLEVTAGEYRPLGAATGEKKSWLIPVCVHYAEGEGAGRTCILASKPSTRLTLPGAACPRFIHPNAGQAGYYRSTLALGALTSLARLSIGALAVRERVGVLLDAWALVESGAIGAGDFLSLAERFRGDPEQAVWQRIVESLEFLDDEVVSDGEQSALSSFATRLLAKEARALGWESKPKELDGDRMRRRLVLEALGRVGRDAPTIGKARALTERWLTDPATVDGDAASVALPLTAMSGDAALFDRFRARLAATEIPTERVLALSALSAFTDPGLVRRALELLLDGSVRTQDQTYVLRGVFARPSTREIAFQVVSEHIDQFLAKIPPFARGRLMPVVARACSDAEGERARALLGPRLGLLEGADRGLAQALEATHRCAAFREHHRAGLDAWLAAFAKGSPRPQ